MSFHLFEFEETLDLLPERVLWLAVIERAIMDYCFPTKRLQKKDVSDLVWFFFVEQPKKFNLSYICNYLFDNDEAASLIRNRVKQMKESPEARTEFERARYRVSALCAFQLGSKPEMPHTEERRQLLALRPLRGYSRRVQKHQRPKGFRRPTSKDGE